MGFNNDLKVYITHTKDGGAVKVFRATVVGTVVEIEDNKFEIHAGVSLSSPQDAFDKEFGINQALEMHDNNPLIKTITKKPSGKEVVLTLQNIGLNVVVRAYSNQRPFIKLV